MRLIDADELVKRFKIIANDNWNKQTPTSWGAAFSDAIEIVDEQPAIDPVKHGRWVRLTEDGYEPQEYMCSLCCRTIRYLGAPALLIERYPYCHCGAKMDGGDA